MTEWTTLSVKEDTLERFRDIKEQLDETQDAPDHSADSFLNALLDTWEAAEDGYYDGGVGDLRPFGGKAPDVIEGDVEVEPIVDYEEIAARITDKIEETNGVHIENVEIDDSGSTMERSEVEGIIENWVERNYDRLRRGEL